MSYTEILKFAAEKAAGMGMETLKQGAGAEEDMQSLAAFVGAQRSQDIYRQLQTASISSSFDISTLVKADRSLMSIGVDADQAFHDTMDLANAMVAVGGNNESLTRLAQNMQLVKMEGTASKEELKAFAKEGINIYQLLADATGKPIDKIKNLAVSYDMLSKALDKASGKGGVYAGAMNGGSDTISGKWNTFTNYVKLGEQSLTQNQQTNIKQIEDVLIAAAKKIPEIVEAVGPFFTRVFAAVNELMPYIKTVIEKTLEALKPVGDFLTSPEIINLAKSMMTVSSDLLTLLKPAIEMAVEALKPLARLLTRFGNVADEILNPPAAQEENRGKSEYWNRYWGETMGRGYPMSGGVDAMWPRVKAIDPRLFNLMHPSNGNLVSVNPYNLQMQLQQQSIAAERQAEKGKPKTFDFSGINNKSDKISSGGTRTVTINVGKMIDNFTIHTQTINEGIDNLDNQVAESLLRVLHSSAKMRE